MKVALVATVLGTLAASTNGYVLEAADASLEALENLRRALPNSPKGYTPSFVTCPQTAPSVRAATSLSPNETAWLEKRRNNTITPMRNLLNRLDIGNFNAGEYIDNHSDNASALPNIGIAVSGGGWRALMNGAGALKAFDSRTRNNTGDGKLGGLLQSATYLSGLSGGGWLVGSLFMNNFTTVGALQADTSGSVWEFGNSVLEGPDTGGLQILDTAEYYANLASDVNGKDDAGFDVSLTDVWGRALSFQLINATDGGPKYTFSSIAISQPFQDANSPFPILVADARAPGETLIPGNTTVYEFNPFEMGSWDPTSYGFVPTKYLGTNFTAGEVPNDDRCVIGFDNGGYIMGTSSTLFNQFILNLNETDIPGTLKSLIANILGGVDEDNNDIADYTPNPFFHYRPEHNPSANSTRLTLVDGGEDLQNIPLHPLIQPYRNVDVIFAVDSSADTNYNWPNATALVATYERSQSNMSNNTLFPSIPDQNTIVNLGLNTRPTFFGCDVSNFTEGAHIPPLVVYIPNSPYVTFSNESTFTLSTNNSYRDAIILNGQDVATMGNGTVDDTWPTCVGCAILSRSLDRTGTDIPEVCQQCFNRFCWNGTIDSSTPEPYEPTPILTQLDISSKGSTSLFSRWTAAAAAAMALATTL
ncbi:Lysophospholipase 1 [Exophiala xenobiotica]|uniref:Lysophospholipase n=1 Tax=Vermiconidia calcicola TaxID=1690605 RepID=A0AAV9Q1Q1_9PEZI|nr:Lysophospholipase 1 [Exophiala xenobiotica]KAK5533965.1 Lysophospholipase 1 [Vermiconidia calcicola]KAK5534881.1 Lysophospholipase 1 [Chaetothyriales sp. CCFEE 6169]KAK5272142.1 Lysophospholipase 1 [Exophiala xenobiotica]KAK5292498.1 Lysophospholipase 1 [Exophiala xenobiotica]